MLHVEAVNGIASKLQPDTPDQVKLRSGIMPEEGGNLRDEPLGTRDVQGCHVGICLDDFLLTRPGHPQASDHREPIRTVFVQDLPA